MLARNGSKEWSRRLIAGSIVVVALTCGRYLDRPEYPITGFVRVPHGYPEIFQMREDPPSDDVAATKRMAAERDEVRRRLREEGAYSRATTDEQKALDACWNNHYVEAREIATRLLRYDPRSVPALYAFGQVMLYGEANLPLSLAYLRKMRRLLERGARAGQLGSDAREWYLRGLQSEYRVLDLLDYGEDQLACAEAIDRVYFPRPWVRIWPLIKLHRLDQVKALLDQVDAQKTHPGTVANLRLVLESESNNRASAYRVGNRSSRASKSSVVWSNFHLTCLSDFRLEEAELAQKRAIELLDQEEAHSPSIDLAQLYTTQGRLMEAWAALLCAKQERQKRAIETLEQDRGQMDAAIAGLMLAMGRGEDAERFGRRATGRPSRTGRTSTSVQMGELRSSLMLSTILRSRLEENEELAGKGQNLRRLVASVAAKIELGLLNRRLVGLLSDPTLRDEILRPYMPRTEDSRPWLTNELMRILPAGIAAEALAQARSKEAHPKAVPYFDAMGAELALVRHDYAEARRLAGKAIAGLPTVGEQLLRLRAMTVAAAAAWSTGDHRAALEWLDPVLADFPAALRLVGMAIPVKVTQDKSPLAARLAAAILRSPRFVADTSGFPLLIRTDGTSVVLELRRRYGARHIEFALPMGGPPEGVVSTALTRLHTTLMSPRLDLSQTDLNGLDGSVAAAQSNSDVKSLLDPAPVRGN